MAPSLLRCMAMRCCPGPLRMCCVVSDQVLQAQPGAGPETGRRPTQALATAGHLFWCSSALRTSCRNSGVRCGRHAAPHPSMSACICRGAAHHRADRARGKRDGGNSPISAKQVVWTGSWDRTSDSSHASSACNVPACLGVALDYRRLMCSPREESPAAP